MTLILTLDIDIIMMYLHTKNEVSRLSFKSVCPNRAHIFRSCDLDLDPMTVIHELDLYIVMMYLHAKNKLSKSRPSKVRARTDKHTHTHTHTHRRD